MSDREHAIKAAADALRTLAPGHECRRIWGRAAPGPGPGPVRFDSDAVPDPDDEGAAGNVWAADPEDIARVVLTAAADQRRQQELDRLDQMEEAAWHRARGGEVRAIETMLKITKHRIRLLGLTPDASSAGTDQTDRDQAREAHAPERLRDNRGDAARQTLNLIVDWLLRNYPSDEADRAATALSEPAAVSRPAAACIIDAIRHVTDIGGTAREPSQDPAAHNWTLIEESAGGGKPCHPVPCSLDEETAPQ